MQTYIYASRTTTLSNSVDTELRPRRQCKTGRIVRPPITEVRAEQDDTSSLNV